MRKVNYEQQIEKVGNIWNFSLIAPRFWFVKNWNDKYKLFKIREWLEIFTNNLKCENYDCVAEFEKFSQLPKKCLIEIFESEYQDWFINNLEKLYPNKIDWPNLDEQIVLKICMSFPETFYKLQNSKSIWNQKWQNLKNFKEWCILMWIWDNNVCLIEDFYRNVRCELYHFWAIKWNWYIDYQDNEKAMDVIYKKLGSNCINLSEFIRKIKESMDRYISEIGKNEKLYNIFFENYVKDLDIYLS